MYQLYHLKYLSIFQFQGIGIYFIILCYFKHFIVATLVFLLATAYKEDKQRQIVRLLQKKLVFQ